MVNRYFKKKQITLIEPTKYG